MNKKNSDPADLHSIALPLQQPESTGGRLPAVLMSPVSRAGDGEPLALASNVVVKRTWQLAPAHRSGDAPVQAKVAAGPVLLALEAVDGSTIFIRADTLAEQLERSRPDLLDPDGVIDFARFRDSRDLSRGIVGWIWRKISELGLQEDEITAEARARMLEGMADQVSGLASAWASHHGARALMAAIENRLAGAPGLYRWTGGAIRPEDACAPGDGRLETAARAGPLLVFIHGTGSSTVGGFSELVQSSAWGLLTQGYQDRLFGFEHRTFSESPIDNALALASALPAGTRLHIVSHSRGGLVGDLMCLDAAAGDLDTLIDLYRHELSPDEKEDKEKEPRLRAAREAENARMQARLRQLVALLREKHIQVERYVRVAAPARGTALLSDNLDVFLSCLLNLVRRFGGWTAGLAAGAVAGPAAGLALRTTADRALAFLTRVVLEIADKRLQPQLVPGIEAMLPESPLGMLLATAPMSRTTRLAVVAGDVQGADAGLLARIGLMFVDWAFFDKARNDLVVDTVSMYGGGLASAPDARAIFVEGAQVNHFRYFRDDITSQGISLPAAMRNWLLEPRPEAAVPWAELALPAISVQSTSRAARGAPEPPDNTRPVVIFLPGILGSHLSVDDDRVWLDPLSLIRGGLPRIDMKAPGVVQVGDMVAMSYAKLADFLEDSHRVIRHAYDWRQPVRELGRALAEVVRNALKTHPDQPVRLLAHSMGGLVVRAALAVDAALWDEMLRRPGCRLVMLGVPNRGSHSLVETLLGQAGTVRNLARVDLRHGLQRILDVISGFHGALNLLPAPGFVDTAAQQPAHDYYKARTWNDLADGNNDFWFGRNLGGRPAEGALKQAEDLWKTIAATDWVAKAPDRIAYVFGKADNTPCGIAPQVKKKSSGGVMMLGTPHGDGSVTWKSGRLDYLPDDRYWFMSVRHGDLANSPDHFGEILALLTQGVARKLGRLPVSRSEEAHAPVIRYRAGPPPGYSPPAELVARIMGVEPEPLPRSESAALCVSVKAMDLRFVQVPVLCGHYRGDPIAGAEAVLDRSMLNGALAHRQRLGVHCGDLGTATVVLMPRSAEERRRQSGRGALVVGLGEMGALTAEGVTQAVRTGTLRYLLLESDRAGEDGGKESPGEGQALPLRLASLLIGTNSSAQLDIEDAVRAVVLGVLRANRDFAAGAQARGAPNVAVTCLEFIEVYRDAAISAAYAVADLERTLASELKSLQTRLVCASELQYGDGVRQRLSMSSYSDYWPRLSITDADRDEGECLAECYTPRIRNPIPPHVLRQILTLYGIASEKDRVLALLPGLDNAPVVRHAQRLHFTYMGEKARAEVVVQQRQPALVETFVDTALKGPASTSYSRATGLGNTLFQLLVPLAFKNAARKTNNLVLVVDAATANLPWEMLEAEGEPLLRRTRMVRQFATTRFRTDVIRCEGRDACVIANPATDGYYAQFGGPDWTPRLAADGTAQPDCLPNLEGAAREGRAVADVLDAAGYPATWVGSESRADQVITSLFARPYRVLVIAAHGIYGKRGADGFYRSGVVLSDGLVLSAAEIGLMETVPDLVFLSCCHLGKVGVQDAASQRLGASLARELIDMGVRCVVAAGWEVRDDAARTFSETFFERMTSRGTRFADALYEARMAAMNLHPDCNTWGAYQAYGDPSFQLTLQAERLPEHQPLLAPEELLDWIEQLRLDVHLPTAVETQQGFDALAQRVSARMATLPSEWVERAEVQHALGRLYAEYVPAGFTLARTAMLRAIAEDSSNGLVPISTIEQLINLETRQARRLSASGQQADIEQALQLANSAIERGESLLKLSRDGAASMQILLRPNTERQSILGSAYKCKAIVLARSGEGWDTVLAVLQAARDAYDAGDAGPESPGWNPYARVNCLQLNALVGNVPVDGAQVAACLRAARTRFASRYDFFDGAMAGDAAVANWLSTGKLPESEDNLPLDEAAESLARTYRDAVQGLPQTPRQMESVVSQLVFLAELLCLRSAKDDQARSEALWGAAFRLLGREPSVRPPCIGTSSPMQGGQAPGSSGS